MKKIDYPWLLYILMSYDLKTLKKINRKNNSINEDKLIE